MIKKIIQISLVLVVLMNSSCKKWLDLQPQDGITKQEFWKTKEDVKAALNGIYLELVSGGVEERIFLWGEIRADMISITNRAPDDYRQIRNSNILSTNSVSSWGSVYRVINSCNLLLDFAGEAKASDPTFTDKLYNSYVGEALTIRSLMYFYLVRSFRDVPLRLKGAYKDTDIEEIGKTNADLVLKQITSDLDKAKTMVPHSHGASAQVDKGRITRYAVFALLADVHLWNEEYEEAVIAADSVLINPDFSLVKFTGAGFRSVFEQGSSSETIFEFNHQSSISSIFQFLLLDGNRIYTASELVPTNIFTPNMVVGADLQDGRSGSYNTSGTITKYGDANPLFSNFQIYRISDMMMIKAEALNQLDESDRAMGIVRALREERNALDATKPQFTTNDKEDVTLYILEERAREFAFEGKRWFDLLRTAKRDYTDLSVLTNLIVNITDASVQQSALSKIRDVNSHYFPILESELFADTKLVQNPFYVK